MLPRFDTDPQWFLPEDFRKAVCAGTPATRLRRLVHNRLDEELLGRAASVTRLLETSVDYAKRASRT
jgi:hypothetical protein